MHLQLTFNKLWHTTIYIYDRVTMTKISIIHSIHPTTPNIPSTLNPPQPPLPSQPPLWMQPTSLRWKLGGWRGPFSKWCGSMPKLTRSLEGKKAKQSFPFFLSRGSCQTELQRKGKKQRRSFDKLCLWNKLTSKTRFYKLPAARFSRSNQIWSKKIKDSEILMTIFKKSFF